MADGPKAETRAPDGGLRDRTSGPKGLTQGQAVARGRSVLEAQADDYREKLRDDLRALDAAVARDADDPGAVAAAAMEIKSLAATFGHRLAGRTAASLSRYLTYVPASDPKRGEVLHGHLDALRYLVEHESTEADNEALQMVGSLEAAVRLRRRRMADA